MREAVKTNVGTGRHICLINTISNDTHGISGQLNIVIPKSVNALHSYIYRPICAHGYQTLDNCRVISYRDQYPTIRKNSARNYKDFYGTRAHVGACVSVYVI